jgi:uncharacterized membrane protein (UPF0127 family)
MTWPTDNHLHYLQRRNAWLSLLLSLLALTSTFGRAHADGTDSDELNRSFARSTLQIATADSRLHAFNVWIADDDSHRERGLMFVKQLADDAGMLFIYPSPRPMSMWMKNTFLPLDMVFVNAKGRVIRVVENTVPQSLDTIDSGGAALGVIELKGGTAAKLNLRTGAEVIHPAFVAR